jgi:hypothetical protein
MRAQMSRVANNQPKYGNSELILRLNNLVSLFTEKQFLIAQSTGFSSFATPIHPVEFDKQFTVWLMQRVDTMTRTIGPVDKKIMIFQEDAAMVFGVNSSGKEVYDSSLDKSETMREEVMSLVGMDDHRAKPSDAAFKTLSALAGRQMNDEEEAKFKVSFALFIVWLLCDGRNPGEKESVNFWPALKCPAQIHTFNWASYVLDSVISACVNARMATRTNTCYSPPAGTALFLQVPWFVFSARYIAHTTDLTK